MVTFNRLFYTKQAIKSIIENTNIPYELSIVDNYSTDDTRKYLKTLPKDKGSLKRLLLIFNKENIGLAPALNKGLKKSKSDVISFVGQDFAVSKHWLSTLCDAFCKVDNIGWLNPVVNREQLPNSFTEFQIGKYSYIQSKEGRGIIGGNGLISKKTLEEIGGFSTFPDCIYKYSGVDGYTMYNIEKTTGKIICILKNVVVEHLENNDRDRYPNYTKWKFAIRDRINANDRKNRKYIDFNWKKQEEER